MKILSIDVGIKNLAICTICTANNSIECISEWKVINLCKPSIMCTCTTRNGDCKLQAKYSKKDMKYCKKHAEKSQCILPEKIPTIVELKTKQAEDITSLANSLGVCETTKAKLFTKIKDTMKKNALEPVIQPSANAIELPVLAKLITSTLDTEIELQHIDYILIENQIGPLANRMKCLQAMLTQYFVMRGIETVKYISASNKLKYIEGQKESYLERKALATKAVLGYLNSTNSSYKDAFEKCKKNDDLADALLQGIGYLIEKNIIENMFHNADYLK